MPRQKAVCFHLKILLIHLHDKRCTKIDDISIAHIRQQHIREPLWVLKEQVRFDDGVASFDWETYPVLKFSEVPEIDVELINTRDPVPLGVGEATAGPTAAAIGNAVAHALGARIRDLPLTRERVMAALIRD